VNPRTGLGFTNASGDLVDVTWPFGYSAHRKHGLAVLLDEGGRVVAREGDWIMSAGGWGDGDTTFASCGLDPWAGTVLPLTTSNVPKDGCPPALTTGTLTPEPRSGLGVAYESDYVAPTRWPFGYTARDVYGVAVLFDEAGDVVAWQGGLLEFSGGGPIGAWALMCGDIQRTGVDAPGIEKP
jgi:hypothetical protein